MKFHVMTLFPDLVSGVLSESIIGRAQKNGILEVACYDIREFTKDRHRKTDDTPFGGGVGMVMSCQPIFDCYREVLSRASDTSRKRVIYMSPKGRIFNHEKARQLSEYDELIFLCGHYEGVDQRVIDSIVDEEISIGDYVVTGGEIPACIVIDAVSRLKEGVLAESTCYEDESIASGLLEYPQYTKPRVFEDMEVPPVLLSGDHKKIDLWRLEKSLEITKERRPDLYEVWEMAHPAAEKKKRKSSKN